MNEIDLAARLLKLDRSRIKDMIVPTNFVYDYLVREKEITPIERLPYETKRKYWKETEGSKDRRIFTVRALYLYDELKKII